MSELPPIRRGAAVPQQSGLAEEQRGAAVSEPMQEQVPTVPQHRWIPKEQARLALELERDMESSVGKPPTKYEVILGGVTTSTGAGVGWIAGGPIGAAIGGGLGAAVGALVSWYAEKEGKVIDKDEARVLLRDLARVAVRSDNGIDGKRYFDADDVDPKYVKPIADILTAFLNGSFTLADGTTVEFDLTPKARTEFENALKAMQ